jgi:S1-C subfamily serine protease
LLLPEPKGCPIEGSDPFTMVRLLVLALALGVVLTGHARAQDGGVPSAPPTASSPPDLRSVHEHCVRSMVRIERPDGAFGSGFVAALRSSSDTSEPLADRRVIVTNAHVAEGVDPLRVVLYDGQTVLAHVRYLSDRIDLAVLVTEEPISAPPLEVVSGALVRGERVVLGGNPGGLFFITTEGVVAGVITGTPLSDQACGPGNNCIVLDTEAEPGSSGGPVVDEEGRVIGMLWGVYTGTSLSVTIHGQTLATELERAGERLGHRVRHARR